MSARQQKTSSSVNSNKKSKKLPTYIKDILKKTRPIYITLAVLIILSTCLEVSLLFMLKDITDYVFKGTNEFSQINIMFLVISISGIIVISFFISKLEAKYICINIQEIKKSYIKKLFNKKIHNFHKENVAQYISKLTNKMSLIEAKYLASKYAILSGTIKIIMGILLSIYVDFKILIFAVCLCIIIFIFMIIINIYINKAFVKLNERYENHTTKTRELLSAIDIIKTNPIQDKILQDFEKHCTSLEKQQIKFNKISVYMNIIMQSLVGAFFAIFLTYCVYQVWHGTYTLGKLMFFIFTLPILIIPGVSLMQNFTFFNAGKDMLIKDVSSILSEDDKNIGQIQFNKFNNKISFENVSFSYDNNIILKDVNFEIIKGYKYLVVGTSGSGKSTLLKLIRNYEQPTDGTVYIDETPLNQLDMHSFFKKTSYLEQNIFLFEDTIKNNICLFNNYTEDKFNQAVSKSSITELINKNSDGTEYIIKDDGTNISGGEKARIALARSFIKDSQIMLLDEPFSSLDEKTSIQIEQDILSQKDLTLINITHVIHKDLLNQYDKIIFVDNKTIKLLNPNEMSF